MYNIFLNKLFQVPGVRTKEMVGGTCVFPVTRANDNFLHRIDFDLCRVIEKSSGEMIIKNVRVFVFLNRDRLL